MIVLVIIFPSVSLLLTDSFQRLPLLFRSQNLAIKITLAEPSHLTGEMTVPQGKKVLTAESDDLGKAAQ